MVSPELREQLILEHLPQVKLIARSLYERIERRVDLDDLVSTGVLGLIDAIDRFDPERQIKLKTYAEHRIRGAILDGLRSLDGASRDARHRAKQLEQAAGVLEQRLQRNPTHDEIAAELGLSAAAYQNAYLASTATLPLALDSEVSEGDEQSGTHAAMQPAAGPSPEATIAAEQLLHLVRTAVDALHPKAKRVIEMHYKQGLTMRQMAPALRLSEWQVQETRRNAISHMRAVLTEHRSLGLASSAEPLHATFF